MKPVNPLLSIGTVVTLLAASAGCAAIQPTGETAEAAAAAIQAEKPDPAAERRLRVRREVMGFIEQNRYLDAWNYTLPTAGLSDSQIATVQAEYDFIRNGVLVERWSAWRIERLRTSVDALVGKKEYAKARELVWRLGKTPCEAVNAKVDTARQKIMRETINTAEWKDASEALNALAKTEDQAAREALAAYPRLRTYTVLFDEQLDKVAAGVVALGVPAEAPKPVIEKVRALIAEVFKDIAEDYETGESKPGELPDFTPYMNEVERLQKLLVRHDCPEADAAAIIQTLKDGLAPLLKQCIIPAPPATVTLKGLGTTTLSEKIEALRAELLVKVVEAELRAKIAAKDWAAVKALLADAALADGAPQEQKDALEKLRATLRTEATIAEIRALTEALEADIRAKTEAQDWEGARAAIRDCPIPENPTIAVALHVWRIGLLNAVVNPAQCKALSDEMTARCEGIDTMTPAQLLETRTWLLARQGIQDDYPNIAAALESAHGAIVTLGVPDAETDREIDAVNGDVQDLLDARTGDLPRQAPDLTELDKAIERLEAAIAEQAPQADAKRWGEQLRAFVMEHLDRSEALTTAQANRTLAALRDRLLGKLDLLLARRAVAEAAAEAAEAYKRVLASMDGEVSFDSQIAIARSAIRQERPTASDGFHAVLGDYARCFRLLKAGRPLEAKQHATLVVGAVRLNQPQVIAWAKGLGADLNAPAARDAQGRPPLVVAFEAGNAALIRALIDAGADPAAAKDAAGRTALHHAARRGDLGLIRLALASFDVNTPDAAGRTALFEAAASDQPAIVARLIEYGANPTIADKQGHTPFDIACAEDAAAVLDTLVQAGATPTANALPLAAANDAPAAARWLVAHGVDVNAEGVMQAARPSSATYDFLVSQGGIPTAPAEKADQEP